jgi:hypothetical protein
MNEREEQGDVRLKALLCKRTGVQVAVDEHAHCPYCFGRESEIREGDHQRFCDYRAEVDPIHFGFPQGTLRDRSG